MFTGIIEEVGSIHSLKSIGRGKRIAISANKIFDDLKIDDSVAINGVCLTVVKIENKIFDVEAVEETINKTTLSKFQSNQKVNLERALKLETRLGGHLVQGHVDCVGTVSSIQRQSAGQNVWFNFPKEYSSLVVKTGSICINGVSLTIARLEGLRLMVSIIPHTWEVTTFNELRSGSEVNLEFDIIGKYILRLSETANIKNESQSDAYFKAKFPMELE